MAHPHRTRSVQRDSLDLNPLASYRGVRAGLAVEPLPLMLRAALTLIVFCGGAQAYIAFRIAMDGPMFGAWARAQWAGADVLDAFDRALHQLRLSNTPSRSRTLEERVRGLFALVRVSAGLFVLQLAAALAACWI
jgi:hypothetical protein